MKNAIQINLAVMRIIIPENITKGTELKGKLQRSIKISLKFTLKIENAHPGTYIQYILFPLFLPL